MKKLFIDLVEVNFEVVCKCCGNPSNVYLNKTRCYHNPVLIIECKNKDCGESFDSLLDGQYYIPSY